jgi:Rod binding domain-containing protein
VNIATLQPRVKAADLPLDKLSANPHLSEQDKVAEVTRQFEALLLRQILQQVRKTTFASKFDSETATTAIYQDMINFQLADGISRAGTFGLASSLKTQLSHQVLPPPQTKLAPSAGGDDLLPQPEPHLP